MRAYDLTVTGSLIITGSIINADGTSFLTGSNAGASASFSTRTTTLETSGSITESSASYSTRVTLLEGSGSITESSASYSTRVTTEEGNVDSLQTDSGSFSTRVALLEGSGSITESSASYSTRVALLEGSGSITESSASFSTRVTTEEGNVDDLQTDSGSFSTRVTVTEASGALINQDLTTDAAVTFATVDTGQGANELYDMDQNVKTDSNVTFGNVTATGTVTAEEFHTEFVSASIVYVSGSTKFGDTSDDVHSFTGSIHLVNSGSVSGSIFSTGSFGAIYAGGMSVPNLINVSSSVSSRVNLLEGSGSITESSSSFSTRATTLENANISGGFVAQTVLSGSGTLISGSALSTGSFGDGRFVGKVGIGNVNPVYGSVAGLHIHSDSNQLGITNDTTGATSTDGFGIAVVSNKDAQILQKENASMQFYTNDTHRMIISSSGEVGIGTTNPGVALEVIGSVSGSHNSTGSFGQLKTGDLELENERGHWAIIEEEEYLSIHNVKTDKKYKFVLEEIE